MFQLQIADLDATSGSIPVSWCLDEETINMMAKEKVANPQVVICVAPSNTEEKAHRYHTEKEYRKVVPLKDLMTFVEFRSSGPCKIWGFISFKKKKGEAQSTYLERRDGEFRTNILDYDGEEYAHWLLDEETREARESKKYTSLSQPIKVDVPAGVFAPEPKEWEKAWVNHLFKDKVIDQCEFRRRRLFAYGVQPFIMFGNLFVRFLMLLLGCLLLLKATSLKWLLHPLTYTLGDGWEMFEEGSWVVFPESVNKEPDNKFPRPAAFIRSCWLMPLMPLFWLPVALLLFKGWMTAALVVTIIFVGLALLLLLVATLANYFKLAGKPFVWAYEYLTKEDPNQELWYMDQKEIGLITCTKDKKALTFKDLPANHKTFHLRFQNLKSKVCRPFSV
jgi:hypothetical protein